MPRRSASIRRSSRPFWVMGIGLALIAVALLLARQRGAAPLASPTPLPVGPDEVPRVTLADARAAFDGGTAVFLDVRSSDDYAAGHIPGALSIPLAELESRLGELDPGSWIITYCT